MIDKGQEISEAIFHGFNSPNKNHYFFFLISVLKAKKGQIKINKGILINQIALKLAAKTTYNKQTCLGTHYQLKLNLVKKIVKIRRGCLDTASKIYNSKYSTYIVHIYNMY